VEELINDEPAENEGAVRLKPGNFNGTQYKKIQNKMEASWQYTIGMLAGKINYLCVH
jgi:hypothetical protein